MSSIIAAPPKIQAPKWKLFKALFKGAPGTRKTVEAAKFRFRHPDLRAIWFDFDDGFAPIDEHVPNHGIEHHYYGMYNLKAADDFLQELLANPKDLGLVCFDSTTFMGDTGIGYSRMVSTNQNLQSRGFIPLPSMDDYKVEEALMFRVMQAIHALPCDVILTMHEVLMDKLVQRPDPKRPGEYLTVEVKERFTVTAARKTKIIAPAGFTEIYHFHATPLNVLQPEKGARYWVQTRNEGEFTAKTAIGLPPHIEYANDERPNEQRPLWELIREELAKKGREF